MSTIGITHLAYRLPEQRLSLENAAQRGLFASEASFLREIGFEYCFVEDDPLVHDDMIVDCGQDLLARSALPRDQVGWLFRCSGLPNELPVSRKGDMLAQFRYPVGRSQQRLDLQRASGMALSLQRVARPMLYTSVVLVAGFLSMLSNDLLAIRDMGLMASATLLMALITDLYLVPALYLATAKTQHAVGTPIH